MLVSQNPMKKKECKHNFVFDYAMETEQGRAMRFVYHCTKCCQVDAYTKSK